jgi:hypothetical protein
LPRWQPRLQLHLLLPLPQLLHQHQRLRPPRLLPQHP